MTPPPRDGRWRPLARLSAFARVAVASAAFRRAVQLNTLLLALLAVLWHPGEQARWLICSTTFASTSSGHHGPTSIGPPLPESTLPGLTPHQHGHADASPAEAATAALAPLSLTPAECLPHLALHLAEGALVAVFALEIAVRIAARGPALYLELSRWNYFDGALAAASVVAYVLANALANVELDQRVSAALVDLVCGLQHMACGHVCVCVSW